MRTDALAAVLRPLHGYLARVTERADARARGAGLTVEVGRGGVRRYRDPRMDHLAARPAVGPCAGVRVTATAWSTPTLTVSAALAGAGWSR